MTQEELLKFHWHLQEVDNIYNAINSWDYYRFACLMKDGTVQEFSGIADEAYNGEINIHIDGVNDEYDDTDEIVMWIEVPSLK